MAAPLLLPNASRNDEVVRLLLARQDIDVEAGSASPLIMASHKGYEQTVQLLLQPAGVNVNGTDDGECTAIGYAIKYNRVGIVHLLLSDPRLDINIDMKAALGIL